MLINEFFGSPSLVKSSPLSLRYRYASETSNGILGVQTDFDLSKLNEKDPSLSYRLGFEDFSYQSVTLNGSFSVDQIPSSEAFSTLETKNLVLKRPRQTFAFRGEMKFRHDEENSWVQGRGDWTRGAWTYELRMDEPLRMIPTFPLPLGPTIEFHHPGSETRMVTLPASEDDPLTVTIGDKSRTFAIR